MEVNINLFLLFYRKHFLQEPRVFLSDIHLTQLRNVFKTFLTNSFAVGYLYQTFVQINSKYVYDALLMSGVDAMSEIGEGSEIFHNISSHQTSDQGGGGEAARMIVVNRYLPDVFLVSPSVPRPDHPPVHSCSYQRRHVWSLWNR